MNKNPKNFPCKCGCLRGDHSDLLLDPFDTGKYDKMVTACHNCRPVYDEPLAKVCSEFVPDNLRYLELFIVNNPSL